MPVSFPSFPADWRLPLYWVEVDPSMAGLPTIKQPALLVGQKLAAGSATLDEPVAVGTQEQAKTMFGEGSMLERMFAAYYGNSFAHEVWAIPVADPAGVRSEGSIEITHAATAAGILYVYIAGQRIPVAVGASDSAVTIAAAIVAAVNAKTTLPVTATGGSDDAKVTLRCRWVGDTGDDIDIRVNYLGAISNEVTPAGVTYTITAMDGGDGAPDFSGAIAAIADDNYDYCGVPYTDAATLSDFETEYGFGGDTGRWGWLRQLYGSLYSAKRGSYSDLMDWGKLQNSPVLSVMAVEADSPSPMWEWTAAYTAMAARALTADPARPLQTLPLAGIKPARKHFRFVRTELNNLAGQGLATQGVNADGVPAILRETTTYQKNTSGFGDDAYTDVTTLATLARIMRNQRHAITSKYPRHKLADNGTRFGIGQAIVTPNIIKAELIAQYAIDEYNGLVENVSAFKANLIVERDPNNPNRVNVIYPPDLVNGLRLFAVLAQFRLQYDRGIDVAIA